MTSTGRAGEKKRIGMLMESGRLEEAQAACIALCDKSGNDAEAWFVLGLINSRGGNLDEAIVNWRQATRLAPGFAAAQLNLAQALCLQGRVEEAVAHFRITLKQRPDSIEAHHGLAVALKQSGSLQEAIRHFEYTLQLNPDHARAHNNLAMALKDQGRVQEAIDEFRAAMRCRPDYVQAHSNLLLTINYVFGYTPESLFEAHREWGARHAVNLRQMAGFANAVNPQRRLRIGYVSPDFRTHSVACFIEPLLAHHDRAVTEVTAYADVDRPDVVTERLLGLCDRYHLIAEKSDAEVAALVRQDEVDILVDLAGHMMKNRLLVFARKPAPVQVNYLGYPNTSGIRAMDYRLTDARADPPGKTEQWHTETLVRLPQGFLCYRPPSNAPAVGTLPAATAGYVTFGSFNNLAKIGPEIIRSWAQLLHTVTGSRLVIKNKSLRDPATCERYRRLFSDEGIVGRRLDLVGFITDGREHLDFYNRIDIGLDTFPYNGTTTTCEALWMGVPVVTLAGTMHRCRVGASLLTQVGMEEFIAGDEDQYIAIAERWAAASGNLSNLRAGLRERVAKSPLCDGVAFTRHVEHAYRSMWYQWCL